MFLFFFFFFFQAEDGIRDSKRDWSSDVCSSDLPSSLQSYTPAQAIDGVELVELKRFSDDGGNFTELVRLGAGRAEALRDFTVHQVNYSERSEERRVGKECRARRRRCNYDKEDTH